MGGINIDTDNDVIPDNEQTEDTLSDIWIRRQEALMKNLAEQREKANAFVKRTCDGLIKNISLAEMKSLDVEQMRFSLRLSEIDVGDNIEIPIIKAAARDYIERSNLEGLDVVFEYADGDEEDEFLLLITKKEAKGGDK